MKSESRWANFRNSISCSWVSPLVLQWTEETAMNKKNEANKLKELPCKQHKIITWLAVLYNSRYNFWSSRYHGNSTKVSSLHCSWMLTGASWNTAHFCIYTTWLRPIIPAHGFYTNDTQPCFSFQPHDTCSSVNLPFIWEFDADECWTTPWSQEISLLPLCHHTTFKTLLLNIEGQNSFSNLHSSQILSVF